MDTSVLEIRDYNGEGYLPLVDYASWRVAFLRYIDELQPDRIDAMERHTETDEVFVLLCGQGVLLLGGNGGRVTGIDPLGMERAKIYNVKRNAWHSILLSRDATVLLVENQDTGTQNSEYTRLTEEQKQAIIKIAGQYMDPDAADQSS